MPELINPLLIEGEFRRCGRDLLYFLEEYWKVQRIGVGYGKFELYDYQREDAADFEAVHRYADLLLAWNAGESEEPPPYELVRKLRQIRLKARQLGWTTLATGAVFWSAFFHGNHPWLIAAQGQEDASITMTQQIKAPYGYLPKWMRDRGPQVIKDGAEDFNFDNGSRIRVIPTTPSAGRGDAMYGALLDEAAFAESAADLFAAVDPMCYGPMFVFSTANGMGNFFHETWEDSELSDSEWEGKFRPWWDRPGRDEEWYETQQRKYRNKPHLLYQEYPSTSVEAFSKSGRLGLPVERIEEMQSFTPPHWRYDAQQIIDEMVDPLPVDSWENLFKRALLEDGETAEHEFHVWRRPNVVRDEHGRPVYTPNYVVSADVSEGLEDGDFDAVTVVDTNTRDVVGTLKSHLALPTFDSFLEAVGYWYYTALIGVERNNHGMVPLVALQKSHYPRLYRMDSLAQIRTADRTPRYGWHTGPSTKPKLVSEMGKFLGDAVYTIHDERFLYETKHFLSNGKGGYGATEGKHDDLIMSVGIGIQVAEDVGQSPAIFYDPEPGPPTFGEMFANTREVKPRGPSPLAAPIGQEAPAKVKGNAWRMVPT